MQAQAKLKTLEMSNKEIIYVETKTCIVCGRNGAVKCYRIDYDKWRTGTYVQDAMPYLSAGRREQLINGVHPNCSKSIYGQDKCEHVWEDGWCEKCELRITEQHKEEDNDLFMGYYEDTKQ